MCIRDRGKHVGVVVLSAIGSGREVIAHRGPHARHFVGHDARTNTCTVDDNAPVGTAFGHHPGNCKGEIRVVHGLRAVRATIYHLPPEFDQKGFQLFLEAIAAMVGAKCDGLLGETAGSR